jgi:PTS system fructose-specific IIA component
MTDTPAALVTPQIVSLDVPLGADSTEIIRSLTGLLHDAGRVDDVDVFVEGVLAREALGSTVLPGGIAIPHARSATATTLSVAVARFPEPTVFRDEAEPIRIVFLIAGPADDPAGYLRLLAKIATVCVKYSFVDQLLAARTVDELAALAVEATGRR